MMITDSGLLFWATLYITLRISSVVWLLLCILCML